VTQCVLVLVGVDTECPCVGYSGQCVHVDTECHCGVDTACPHVGCSTQCVRMLVGVDTECQCVGYSLCVGCTGSM